MWDGDGQDTYDFSVYSTPLSIDLSPGGISDLDVGGVHQRADLGAFDVLAAPIDAPLEPIYARGHLFNSFLFDDDPRSLIEHAIGGTASDFLLGNVASNRLEGGDGNDILDGREGDDQLLDGAGEDRLTGGLNADVFVLAADGQVDVITDFDNTSDLIDISAWAIADISQITIAATSLGTQLQFQQEILNLEGVDVASFDSSRLIGFAPLNANGLSPQSLPIAPFSIASLPMTPLPITPLSGSSSPISS
ncbi:MAG: hypothetical protein F6K09_04440 [Merismopedia sp. SIO2A8]|nr:hypothetical protein [Merismopedia sp. SIO2A8]